NHLQVFLEPLAQLIQGNAECQSLPFHKAMADAELESSLAQTVERGIILGDPKRTVVWQQDHRGSDANFGGFLCYRSGDDWSGRKMERMKGKIRERAVAAFCSRWRTWSGLKFYYSSRQTAAVTEASSTRSEKVRFSARRRAPTTTVWRESNFPVSS